VDTDRHCHCISNGYSDLVVDASGADEWQESSSTSWRTARAPWSVIVLLQWFTSALTFVCWVLAIPQPPWMRVPVKRIASKSLHCGVCWVGFRRHVTACSLQHCLPYQSKLTCSCVCGHGLADLACDLACEALVGWSVPASCIAPAFDPKPAGRAAAFGKVVALEPNGTATSPFTTSQTDLHFATQQPPLNGVVASCDAYGSARDHSSR